jgi:2-oxoglutarate dehydrogenase E1 component
VPPLPVMPPTGAARRACTAVPLDRLTALNRELLRCPRASRCTASSNAGANGARACSQQPDERTIDWAAAEELALASVLEDGIAIRLTGEDVERGTFSQRHAVLHDSVTGEEHVPLGALPRAAASFEIHNSPLSENAAVGFEFGYNIQEPRRLVLWEGAVRRLHQRRPGRAR